MRTTDVRYFIFASSVWRYPIYCLLCRSFCAGLDGWTEPSIELYTYILRRCLEVQSSTLQLLPLKRVTVWWGFIMLSRCSNSMKTSYTTLLNDVSGSMRLWGEASKTRRDIHMSRKCGRYLLEGPPKRRHFRGFKRGQKRLHFEPFLALFKALKRPQNSLKKAHFWPFLGQKGPLLAAI
jgi:hypothetical protein